MNVDKTTEIQQWESTSLLNGNTYQLENSGLSKITDVFAHDI